MQLAPFLLDQWLTCYEFATPPIRYNCASSTGPAWTFGEIAALGDGPLSIENVRLSYAPPQGSDELRQAIARFYGVDPDWVIAMTGASEALLSMYCATIDNGAAILLPSPVFPAMDTIARAWGFEVITYDLDRVHGFVHTADRVLAKVTGGTKLVLINTPHNPTGSVMAASETQRLAAALAARNTPLLVDEVYHPLYFGTPTISASHVPNAIVASDFSKAFSLPGLRIGWIIDRDAERRKRLIDIRSYFTISGSPVTEAIAVHALRNIDALLERLNEVANRNLQTLSQFMNLHKDIFDWVPPQGGTVAFPWRRDGKSSRSLCVRLAQAGVLFAPGDCFAADDHFRIGFGALAKGFDDALEIASGVIGRM